MSHPPPLPDPDDLPEESPRTLAARDYDPPFLAAFPHPLWGGDDGAVPLPVQWDRLRSWWDEHWPLRNHASRCPPLTLANQHGWVLTCPFSFTAIWHGGSEPESMELRAHEPSDRFAALVTRHVGGGCVSINTGQIWRSSRDLILYVKGVPNHFKAGAHCFDALVETDWLLGAFNLVYKLTHPGQEVVFERGEPIAHVLPLQRGLVEQIGTRWVNSGEEFRKRMHEFALFDLRREQVPMNRDYARGVDARGVRYPEHQNVNREESFTRASLPPDDALHRWPDQRAFWKTYLAPEDFEAIEARRPKPAAPPPAEPPAASPEERQLWQAVRKLLRDTASNDPDELAKLERIVREELERARGPE